MQNEQNINPKKKKYLPSLGEETYYLSNNLKEQL